MSGIRVQGSGVSITCVPNISYICNLVNVKYFFLKKVEKKWNIGTNDYYCCISMLLDDLVLGTWWYKVVQTTLKTPRARVNCIKMFYRELLKIPYRKI